MHTVKYSHNIASMNIINRTFKQYLYICAITASMFVVCTDLIAATFTLRNSSDSVIGEISTTQVKLNDTLLDIARANGFGYYDIKLLNPEVDTWLPDEGQQVQLPTKFVLPNAPRQGIVLNIPEMRLYYFPELKQGEARQIITYPIGIGREGWNTPYVKTRVTGKKVHPNWYPPESIRAEHAEEGDPLPKVVKPGPDNPLGDYAFTLALPLYLIHGTNKPYGVGMRVSHGCIRLYPEDIEALFHNVKPGTPVNIINQPYKIGEQDGVIYLEAHPYLEEDTQHFSQNNLTDVVKYVVEMTQERQYKIDWDIVKQVVLENKGIPVAIGMHIPEMQASIENKISAVPKQDTKVKNNGVDLRLETNIGQLQE